MPTPYTRISGDSHLEIRHDRWTHRVDPKFRDRAPRTVRLDSGADAAVFEDEGPTQNPMDLYGGKGRDVWYPGGQRYEETPGTGPPAQRLQEQDLDGIDAEVLFPAVVAGPRMWTKTADAALQKAVFRGYNDWLAEEYCSEAPRRLLGIGALPATGVDDCIEEMERGKRSGLTGVQLMTFPNGGGKPAEEDDRFWAAALDLEMPVTIHVELIRPGARESKLLDYPIEEPGLTTELAFQVQRFATRGAGTNAVQLLLSGIFDRYPTLRVFCAETSIGWVPYFLEIADVRYKRHIHWAEKRNGFKPLRALPSELLNEYFYWGFQRDRSGVELRHRMNVDRLIWSVDFPHQESDWPESDEVIEHNFTGVPDDEVYKMTVQNAVDFFHLRNSPH